MRTTEVSDRQQVLIIPCVYYNNLAYTFMVFHHCPVLQCGISIGTSLCILYYYVSENVVNIVEFITYKYNITQP